MKTIEPLSIEVDHSATSIGQPVIFAPPRGLGSSLTVGRHASSFRGYKFEAVSVVRSTAPAETRGSRGDGGGDGAGSLHHNHSFLE